MNKTSISSLSAIASVMFSALFMAACQRDIAEGRPVFGKRAADGMISVVVNIARDAATTRSAIFGEGAESTIRDMNIWVYAPDGSLTDNLYADGLSISGTGTVSYTTYGDPESDVVYLANLGRKVTAPAEYGDSTTFRRTFSSTVW